MTRGKILLTGSSGQVGGELLRTLAPLGEIAAPARGELDLSRPESVRAAVRAVRPRWIVNPAAYTAVDRAESDDALAFAVNAESVGVLGEEAKRMGAVVVHFSTDYVFSGELDRPYRETDATGPINVYGASKLAGELALAASGAAHLIVRTSWVYGATGNNFLRTILKLARERKSLRIVADQHGAPTASRDVATMAAAIMERIEAKTAADGDLMEAASPFTGIYHASGAGETTWHGFAEEAIRWTRNREPESRFASIVPITTAEYPTPARRPRNSRLDCGKLSEIFRWTMPPWKEALNDVLSGLPV